VDHNTEDSEGREAEQLKLPDSYSGSRRGRRLLVPMMVMKKRHP
jgi:hypothetical protein